MTDFTPVITDGLLIAPFRAELLCERYVDWLNDPDVVRYSEQRHRVHSLQSCSGYWQMVKSTNDLFLSIELIDHAPRHIGNMSVSIDGPNKSADLSIMIGDKSVWRQGYASKAWIAIVNVLLYELGFRRVTAGTMEVNEPMLRLLKRSQMDIDCIRPRHFLWENQEVSLVCASRFP